MDLPKDYRSLERGRRQKAVSEIVEELRTNPDMAVTINGKPMFTPTLNIQSAQSYWQRIEDYIETGLF